MSPADIAAAELRAGFARRLTELGLLPPDPAVFRLPAVARAARSRGRRRPRGRMSIAIPSRGGALRRPALRPAAVLAVGSASSFLVYLDATIVTVAFPDIRASFAGTTLSSLSWVLSAYGIFFAALLVPAGRLADVVGGRRLFLGRARRLHASARCSARRLRASWLLVGARVLQAAGGALLVPAAQLLVMAAHPPGSGCG